MSDGRIPYLEKLRGELLDRLPDGASPGPPRRGATRRIGVTPVAAAVSAFVLVLAVGAVIWLVGATGSADPVAGPTTTTSTVATTTTTAPTETTTTVAVAVPPDASTLYRDWRFVSGSVDGEALVPTPAWPAMVLELRREGAMFPVDCNQAQLHVGLVGSSVQLKVGATIAVGCSEYTDEAELFVGAIERADTVHMEGDMLVFSGPDVVFRFAPAEPPEMLSALPFTSAGETVELPFPDGRRRGVLYTLTSPSPYPYRVSHLLTAGADGVGTEPRVEVWAGEVEVPDVEVAGPEPDRLLMPDGLYPGDYLLCSPYWQPDWFCFPIEVRPQPKDWFVTAGADGVVLHDVNGTSRILWQEPAALGFMVGETVVAQGAADGGGFPPSPAGPIVVVENGEVRGLAGTERFVLNDAAVVDERIVALTAAGGADGELAVVDIATGDITEVGTGGVQVRLHDDLVLVLSASGVLEARSTAGELRWQYDAGSEVMVVPAGAGRVRVHLRHVTDGIEYFDETVLDSADGAVLGEGRHEIPLPGDNDHIDGPCLRSEFDDGVVFCPQADGRTVLVDTGPDGWGTLHLAQANGIPTALRPGP